MKAQMRPIPMVVLILGLFVLLACAPKSVAPLESVAPGERGAANAGSIAAQPTMAPLAMDKMAYQGAVEVAPESPAGDRMVIRSAELSIVVGNPAQAMESIIRLASEMKGFVVSSSLYQTQTPEGAQVQEGTITIRVPAERLDEALGRIRALVENPDTDILSQNIYGQDVTKEYTDLQSRLRNLEDAAEQLRKIMDTATKPEEVLQIYNELRQVNEQIEVLKGQIKYYEESAAMSAITVTLRAKEAVAPITIGTWKPEGVARDAIRALIRAYQALVSGAIWLVLFCLPVALPIAIVGWLIWQGFRRWRRTRKQMPKSEAKPPES
ncbi:MAG: DUF4349 domain-containing protein [Thermanaerothrix sp.]|jgi:tellurite resistance-related uncharacterized protein|uniref:DUF4349 domain-containing protein n=1 Tax=Thermanaerothrix solaris TaxID=3058434 RepID=A0ABU3NIN7_9CHLR|nr:DUF4349 domain-containing protein [Thermanaerothrix sp. 4228-RoL]MDT8896709.1 DUF4349 domain-containing protein [Thermanaerothrix sp. 4228-RoL]